MGPIILPEKGSEADGPGGRIAPKLSEARASPVKITLTPPFFCHPKPKPLLWFFSLVPGNVMTLKFLTDASVTAGGFQVRYMTMDLPPKASDGRNTTSQGKTNFLAGKFGIM